MVLVASRGHQLCTTSVVLVASCGRQLCMTSMVLVASWGRQLWYPASVVLVAGRHQLGCLLQSGPWSLWSWVALLILFAAPSCNGAVERRRTGHRQRSQTTAGGRQPGFILQQHTQNPHAHT